MTSDLLTSPLSVRLYERYASGLPIIDYHDHLPTDELCGKKQYSNIYDMWVAGAPYKHRAMRICGVAEKYITGEASQFEKFGEWCRIFPKLIGNPLYYWSKKELSDIFAISLPINQHNADAIWNKADKMLKDGNITVGSLFEQYRVELVCPCASVSDDLSVFCGTDKVVPSLRGDSILAPTKELVESLEQKTHDICCLEAYKKALFSIIDRFCSLGCRFADIAIDDGFLFVGDGNADEAFARIIDGKASEYDGRLFFSQMLVWLAGELAERGMTLQLHIGAVRNTSSRLREIAGTAGGYAGISGNIDISSLIRLFDSMERSQKGIPKLILFTLNPAYNEALAVISGSFSKDGVNGLITLGPAWWWCDHKFGIEGVLEAVSTFGVLSEFVGMTTDSRSIMSLSRHDYFRRVLCSFLADKLIKNEIDATEQEIGELIDSLCYRNAKKLIKGE